MENTTQVNPGIFQVGSHLITSTLGTGVNVVGVINDGVTSARHWSIAGEQISAVSAAFAVEKKTYEIALQRAKFKKVA